MKFAIALLLFAVTQVLADSIDNLVAELSADLSWFGGQTPVLNLPSTASDRDVVTEVFVRNRIDREIVNKFSILSIRDVTISPIPNTYKAALVDTDTIKKIVLFRREGDSWWTRVYSANY